MGGICHLKGKERGNWFEIKCVKEVVTNKEARGEDASFERCLLKSWSRYEGWESANLKEQTKGWENTGTPSVNREKSMRRGL